MLRGVFRENTPVMTVHRHNYNNKGIQRGYMPDLHTSDPTCAQKCRKQTGNRG